MKGQETDTEAPVKPFPDEPLISRLRGSIRHAARAASLYLAYPDPVRKEDAEIKKQLGALRPSIDTAARYLQLELEADEDMAAEVWHDCGRKNPETASNKNNVRTVGTATKKECVELFQLAAAGKLGFPVGWSADLRKFREDLADENWSTTVGTFWVSLEYVIGVGLTALALMLGAPFWFDVLRRVVSLRAAGPRRDDGLSAGADQGKGAQQEQGSLQDQINRSIRLWKIRF